MENGKNDYRSMLSPLDDDPFLNDDVGGFDPLPADESDSIFSVSRLPDAPVSIPRPSEERTDSEPPVEGESAQALAEPLSDPAPPKGQVSRVEDAVLNVLVKHGILKEEQVVQLSRELQPTTPGTPPWRVALSHPDAPREHILAVAAHLHEVTFIELGDVPHHVLAATLMSLPQAFKERCHHLGVLPFACEFGESGQLLLKMATNDPLRPEVEALLRSIQMDTRMYYAPASMLDKAIRSLQAERGSESSE